MTTFPYSDIQAGSIECRSARRRMTDEQREAAFRAAWLKLGIATLDVATIGDEWLRQAIVNLATQRWGSRK